MPLRALNVRGPFKGPSGYDHHVREFVRELHRQGVAVQLIDFPEWGPAKLPAHLQDPWFDSLGAPTGAQVALHFCMPHQVVPDPGRINVNYTMFEATRIPPAWVAHSHRHDLIILPTESSRVVWISSGVPARKIRLCPLGINPDVFAPPITIVPLPLQTDAGRSIERFRVRFLNVSELGPRKNLVGLVGVWLRATSRRDDAILMIKLGRYAPGWFERFQDRVALLQDELGRRLEEAAPIRFIYDLFADAQMPRLYATATHYISLSFGEGWDQAMVEAAASGLKAIAPDHSAYRAYLDPSVAQLIPSRERPAVFTGGGEIGNLFDGVNWWEPDVDEAVACVRRAIEGRDANKAPPRERILSELTWEAATRRLIAILAEAEQAQPSALARPVSNSF
jgi:glycosyltransferase involved in cell wall biosynthesis